MKTVTNWPRVTKITTNSFVFRRLVQVTGANFVNFRKFLLVYLLMFTLVLKLISCVPIFLILLNKSFSYAFTIINVFLVRAYKIILDPSPLIVLSLLPLFPSFLSLQMVVGNFIYLNVRGISNFRKRRTVFTWCRKQKGDVNFLQETHSTKDNELKVLNSFALKKTPGNDGLPIEFYQTFWNSVGEPLVESFKAFLLSKMIYPSSVLTTPPEIIKESSVSLPMDWNR